MTTRQERMAQREQEEAERRRHQPQHVGASTPWAWNESNPYYNDHIRNQNRKPRVPKPTTPQGDLTREPFDWDRLDKEIDSATADFDELLNVLGSVLDRENTFKTAEKERAAEMARNLPAMNRGVQ